MINPPYYIIGLPRSRTAWLANLFTYGPSFCWHEASRNVSGKFELKHWLETTPAYYVGNSDSAMGIYWQDVVCMFENSKVIFVERSMESAKKAYLKAFPFWPVEAVEKSFDTIFEGMGKLTQEIDSKNQMHVDFLSLDNVETVKAMWRFVMPDVQFDKNRYEMLQQMRVDTIWPKMVAAMHPNYRELMKTIPGYSPATGQN